MDSEKKRSKNEVAAELLLLIAHWHSVREILAPINFFSTIAACFCFKYGAIDGFFPVFAALAVLSSLMTLLISLYSKILVSRFGKNA